MAFRITVHLPGIISLCSLIPSGIGATDITKLKANGIHTIGVCYSDFFAVLLNFSVLIPFCRLYFLQLLRGS